jgi:transaldolase
MELYVDTANIEQIKRCAELGFVAGVTTNPSLLAMEDPKIDVKKRILEIHKLIGGHISIEIISTDKKGMIKEAEAILNWCPDATIKIPMLAEGLSAAYELAKKEIPTNVTLVFSPTQAIAAANAGATYVSVFLGRLDDIATSSANVLQQICDIWEVQQYDSLIIAASIRHPQHIIDAAEAGAHIATIPYKVLMQSLEHPLTTAGVDRFLADNAKMNASIKDKKK